MKTKISFLALTGLFALLSQSAPAAVFIVSRPMTIRVAPVPSAPARVVPKPVEEKSHPSILPVTAVIMANEAANTSKCKEEHNDRKDCK